MISPLPNGSFTMKIIDFGLSILSENISTEKFSCGTSGYMAPEMIKDSFSNKADVFSAGATLFKMLTKKSLFKGERYSQLFKLTYYF